jgi:dephospho-CoA kinase
MILIGVTGVVGSGKTTVSGMLRKQGFRIIDLDRIAKEIVEREEVIKDIQRAFGASYITEGKLDIKKVGKLVFYNKEDLKKLESIVHPKIMTDMQATVKNLEAQGTKMVIIDGPLIFEKGLHKELNKTVVVSAETEIIKDRLKKRGMDEEDMNRRMAAQIPLGEKEAQADHVIYNNGTMEDLEKEVDNFLKQIKEWEVEANAS